MKSIKKAILALFLLSPLSVLAQAPSRIVLHPQWASAMTDGVVTMRELNSLLGQIAQPNANTATAPNLKIYKEVTYLMPLEEAVKVIGVTNAVSSLNQVVCPGFPYHSLFAHAYSGVFEDGFSSLFIVTDLAKQVVAIEFGTASPLNKHISFSRERDDGKTYDFVNTRLKALDTAKVTHHLVNVKTGTDYSTYSIKTSTPPEVVRLDSTFLVPGNNQGLAVNLVPKYETRLYIPRPLMELVLHRISQSVR